MATLSHKPTAATRAVVSSLAGYGFTHTEISADVGISEKTLRKHYRSEIEGAIVKANAKVARTLHKMATNGQNVAASIFWMKARAGWRDKPEPADDDTGKNEPRTVVVNVVSGRKPDDNADA